MSIRRWDGGEFEERHSEYWDMRGAIPTVRFHCRTCGAMEIRVCGAVMDDETGLVRRREIEPGTDEMIYEVECVNGHRWWTRSRQWVRLGARFSHGAPLFANEWDLGDTIPEE